MGQDMRGYLEWEMAERARKERDDLKARVAKLEAALREIQSMAGDASISSETLSAFGPLTDIIVHASKALEAVPTSGTAGKEGA